MIGGWGVPLLKATYADNHTAYVADQTTIVPEQDGIVEFHHGRMLGTGQGSTPVKATYVDPLGNSVETTFTAKSSYFPFDYQYVRSDLKGSGTYRNNTASAVFKFNEANSQMGWVYNANVDMTGYKYLVIRLLQKQTADAHLNIYTTQSLTGACYSSPKFDNRQEIVIDLDTCKYTSAANKGKDLNRKTVRMITFTGALANKTLALTEMFLSNDPKYDTTGILDDFLIIEFLEHTFFGLCLHLCLLLRRQLYVSERESFLLDFSKLNILARDVDRLKLRLRNLHGDRFSLLVECYIIRL